MQIDIQTIDPSITTESLTEATVDGHGTFDTLMRAFKAHIDEEWKGNRIKGTEYSQVYLGGLQEVMKTALQLTLQQRSVTLANELQVEQITLAKIAQRKAEAEIVQTEAQTALINQQRTNLVDDLITSALQRSKLDQEIVNLKGQELQTEAQTQLINQQRTNLIDDLLTSAKQRLKLDQEIINLEAQLPLIQAQIVDMQQKGELTKQQVINLKDDLTTNGIQRQKLVQEVANLAAQLPLITAQVAKMQKDGTLVDEQILKMQAEILTEQSTRDRVAQEVILMGAKVVTERAQTEQGIVLTGGSSVLGKQMAVHQGQADAFKNDALQKTAGILVDTWKVRRTTDEATTVDANALNDGVISAAVLAMCRNIQIPV